MYQIAYVGGWMRSGTTLLSKLVGNLDGTLAVGEVSGIWYAADRDQPCSCGEPIRQCPVWRRALAAVELEHSIGPAEYGGMAVVAQNVLRTRSARRLADLSPENPESWPAMVAFYVAVMSTMLRSVSGTTGATTLVDSSKLAPGFLLQRLMPDVSTKVIHIVRDPRAVANSERKTRVREGQGSELIPPGKNALQSVLYWSGSNLSVKRYAQRMDGYLLVRFEDLTSSLDAEMEKVGQFLDAGRPPDGWSLRGQDHIAVGNPARFDGPGREIRADETWRRELPLGEKLLVSTLSLPTRMLLR